MADIELVIKISNYDKEWITNGYHIPEEINMRISETIINGTPLPKGHGDLIDRTEVIKSLFDYHNGKKTIGQCIDDVPTIIEADKKR